MSHAAHLVKRFVGSLWPGGPTQADDAWATRHMVPGEVELWRRMPNADRRHAIGVARRCASLLGNEATRPVMAAALLHDVGKVDSGLGVFSRVAATLAAAARGRERVAAGDGRFARYMRHPEIAAALLRAAGSDSLTVAWAAEHHSPDSTWTVDEHVGAALKAADDD